MLLAFLDFRERKRGLEMMVSRTPQQEAEENAILEQAAQIQAVRKAEQAALQAQRKAAAPAQPGASFVWNFNQFLAIQGVANASQVSCDKVKAQCWHIDIRPVIARLSSCTCLQT